MAFDGLTKASNQTAELTPAVLNEILLYSPDTGDLTWRLRPRCMFASDHEHRRWNTRYAGKKAFSLNSDGYLDGMIFRRMKRAHVIAWALHYGAYPPSDKQIDHIDGDRTNNRITNLRAVTRSENCRNTKRRSNNSSGALGVAPCGKGWRAYIRHDGKNIHLGVYPSVEAASAARAEASERFGYHANHGRTR